MARPKIEFTDKQFEMIDKLINIQCTGEEIASVIGVDYDTLNARIKERYECSFSDYFKKHNGAGKAALRRMQWKLAEKGNATMLVWLGKNMLGQTDKQQIDLDANMAVQIIDDIPQEE